MDDTQIVRGCLAGDVTATNELNALRGRLEGYLCSRGASHDEAADVVADVYTDLFYRERRQPLLELYKEGGKLFSWLATICLNRLTDRKRRQRFIARTPESEPGEEGNDWLENMADTDDAPVEDSTTSKLLQKCLRLAFAKADAEGMLLLKLVYLYQVSQRQLAAAWHCNESTISRKLTAVKDEIREQFQVLVTESEPWLKISWDDMLEVCRSGLLPAQFFQQDSAE